MINITRELLEQYYGFHNESNNDRSLSIHQCVNNRNDYEKENIDERTILNETEEIITRDVVFIFWSLLLFCSHKFCFD